MKKLFLYLILFVGLFLLCYMLANEYYRQQNQTETTENTETAETAETTEIIADSVSPAANEDNGYIVGIRDGCVIVYQSDMNHVFEYTEIDAELLRTLHPEVYDELIETVRFQNRREMYRFLESLSS